ncbi:MAG: HD domain-containing protein, partial [Actinobacteria bacterium]|nr:HD domain-containing protein [Actinomycetota bacterium]
MADIEVTRDGGVATVTINRPQRKNAVTGEMWGQLAETFRALSADTTVRCVVITGAGGEFCSGADLSARTAGERPVHQLVAMRSVNDAALSLHRMPQPTIAKVRGVAVGAGCNLALGCDLVVASETARFSEIFAKRGLSREEIDLKLDLLRPAAKLHDLGKVGIQDSILKAERRLTDEERAVMQTHPVIGAETLNHLESALDDTIAEVILYHQAKWDGTGYP